MKKKKNLLKPNDVNKNETHNQIGQCNPNNIPICGNLESQQGITVYV